MTADTAEPIHTPVEPEDVVAVEHPWISLKPETFQLIRLSALPADRETGLRPLRFISLERVERHNAEESFLRLTLNMPDNKAQQDINTLEIWADHQRKEVRINPDLPLRTDPGNRGLGRFMLAQAAQWAQKKYNHYTVASQTLLVKHASNDAARIRRDHALQAQGFTVEYEDAVKMRASCTVGRVSELHNDWNEKKITLISTLDTAAMLQKADQSLHEKNAQIKTYHDQVQQLKSEDNTLRFTISMLIVFAVFQAALLIWVATR